jgi:hypothetical protein
MERPTKLQDLVTDSRGAVTLEYLLVVMAVGLTTAAALLAALPSVHRAELTQLRSLYGSTP